MFRELSLINYLPDYLRGYDELIKLTDAETPELYLLYEEVKALLNNMFILGADEKGIRRYEKILGIVPASGDSLDARRRRAFARMNEQPPFTQALLRLQLSEYCGSDGFSFEVDYDNYLIRIQLIDPAKSVQIDIFSMIKRMLPANMVTDLLVKHDLPYTLVNIFLPDVGVYRKNTVDYDTHFHDFAQGRAAVTPGVGVYQRIVIN